jgi:hypothetical protein
LRQAAKVDRNQPEIVKALRKIGAGVLITSQLKKAFDILVFYRYNTYVMEIKDGELPPSKKKLTDGEQECKEMIESHGCKYHIVESIEEAFKILGVGE